MNTRKLSLEEMREMEGGMSCRWALTLAGVTSVIGFFTATTVVGTVGSLVAVAYAYDQAFTACQVSPWGERNL